MVTESRFVLHGVPLLVKSDSPRIANAIDARLRNFKDDGSYPANDPGAICIAVRAGRSADARPVDAHGGRVLLEHSAAKLVYFDGQRLLQGAVGKGVSFICDAEGGVADIFVSQCDDESEWACSHPAFSISLIELLRPARLFALHAAGVSHAGRCILIAGGSGSGKSTLAVRLLLAGFDLLGDDTVFLREGSHQVEALGFADEIDVTDQTLELLPQLSPHVRGPRRGRWDKRALWPEEMRQDALVSCGLPSAIVFPEIAHRDTSSIQRMDGREAFGRLLGGALLSNSRDAQANVALLAKLAQQTACYKLETGTDFDSLPSLFSRLA